MIESAWGFRRYAFSDFRPQNTAVGIEQMAPILEKAVSAGDDTFSIGMGRPGGMVSRKMKNGLLDLYKAENMNLSISWYTQKQAESFTP